MQQIATVLCVIAIVGLFVLDRDREARTSKALWIPIIWILINASRPVSFWLGMAPTASESTVYLDGSPIDRFIYIVLLVAGLIVLINRREQVGPLLRRHWPILLFFSYCALSILWSGYPFVTFKHWTKGVGDVVMVLIVATDLEPKAALKRLLARAGFILIPLSLLFSKYYPELGRFLTPGWIMEYTGVTMNKNELGQICMIFGLGSLWCFLSAYRDREDAQRTRRLTAHAALLAIVIWLFCMANSMTSLSCVVLAGVVMVLAGRPAVVRKPSRVQLLVAAAVGLAVFALFFDPTGDLVASVGRNPTLTGRTDLWHWILTIAGNPWVGTGYESFFVGPRLHQLWALDDQAFYSLQEAHSGYLEVYLNLGWIGVSLFAVFMVTGYKKVIAAFRANPNVGRLCLAWFVAGTIYSLTEAGFRMLTPIWIFLLLAVMAVPEAALPESLSPPGLDQTDSVPEFASIVDQEFGVGFREETG
ncbi:MAG: O-antigen ligase family protein [Terriglobia bacterium]